MSRSFQLFRILRPLQVFLLCAGFFVAAAPLPGQAAARSAATPGIDVAAMSLTPADLDAVGLHGWAIATGQPLTRGAVASGIAFERDLDGDAVASEMADSRLVEGYELRLDNPGDTQAPLIQAARSTVLLFGDEEGAASAFAYLTDPSGAGFGDPVEHGTPLGDESAIVRLEGSTAEPFVAFELTVRSGRFIAVVRLVQFTGGDPDVRYARMLASLLLQRIDDALNGQAPALRLSTGSLADPGAVVEHAYYTTVSGEPRRLLDQSDDDVTTNAGEAQDAGLIDEYERRERLSDPAGDGSSTWVLFTTEQFASEEQASSYLAGARSRSAESGTFTDVQALDGVDALGDESTAYTMTLDWAPQQTTYFYQTYGVRIGDRIGWIDLISTGTLPTTIIENLARAQTGCLSGDQCEATVAFPSQSAAPNEGMKSRNGHSSAAEPETQTIPELGLDLTYDSTEWQLQDENWLAPDGLVLFLQRDAASVVSLGRDDASTSTLECVEGRMQALADDEAFGNARPIGPGAGNASAYGIHLGEGDENFLYVECRPLANGDGFAVIVQVGPLANFDARSADREALLDGLQQSA